MAGIFDFLGNLNPEQSNALLTFGSGLLQAGGPSLRPIGFGQAFGGALQQAQAALVEAEQRKLQRQAAQQQQQLLGLKIRDSESDLANQERQRARAAQVQKVLSELYQPAPGSMAPTVANAQAMTQKQQDIADEYTRLMSESQALRAAGLHEDASLRALQALKFQPEYSTTPQTGRRPTGETFQYVMDKLGRQKVISDTLPRDKMETLNLGGVERVINPFEVTPGQTFQRTQTPDSMASVAATLRGQDMTDARARDANQIAKEGKVATTSTALRKEFDDLPEVKSYKKALPAYTSIVDASKRGTPQSDINLVYGLAKIYDPDSVVREGEYNTIAKSASIPDRIKGYAQYLSGGGKLTPSVKAEIVKEATSRINSYEQEYSAARQNYSDIAGRSGGDPSLLFPSKFKPAQDKAGIKPQSKIVKLDGGGSASATLGADGNYYVERGGKRYRVEED